MTRRIIVSSIFGVLCVVGSAFLSSCGKTGASAGAEIAACETFIQGALRSPSTYKRISLGQSDRAVAVVDYNAYKGLNASAGDNPAVRTVSISYDSANAFGTPIRGNQQCDFLLRDSTSNKFESEPSVSATLAGADRAMGTSDACCLPALTQEAAAAVGNMIADSNMMMDDFTGNMTSDSNLTMETQ